MKKYLISAAALILMFDAVFANGLLLLTGTGGGAVGVFEDEFSGPFASWTNVKTSCGAVGNGTTDDTAAIQTCITNLATAGAGTLYFPAGTYKITSTLTGTALYNVQIIGADPATTQISWAGASGGTMWLTNGYRFNREARITWNGNNVAGTIAYHQESTNYGTTNEFNDEVFENGTYGFRIGDNASNADDTVTILRCKFLNLTTAGVSLESNNAVSIWVWDSLFQNDGIGLTNQLGGAYQVLYDIFLNNTTDILDVNGDFLIVQGNYSSGSGQFYHHNPVGQNTNEDLLQGNTIVNTTNTVSVEASNPQQLFLVDNVVCSTNTAQTTASVVLNNGGNTGGNIGSVGNTYTSTSPPTVTGPSTVLWTQQDTNGVSCPAVTQPSYPTPVNYGRQIIDVAVGASAATIQSAINSAVTYQGSHPIVHLPAGSYSIASTITIPANLDVQVIGDGFGTQLNWTGSAGGTIFSLTSPGKALLQDFYITFGNLTLHTSDVPGARIQAWGFLPFAPSNNSSTSLTITGLTNTAINFYDYSGGSAVEGVVTGTGVAVPSTVSFFGAGLDGFGSSGTFQITGNANVLVESFWQENSGQVGSGGTMGTFSGAAGTISFVSGIYLDKTTQSPAVVTLSGYNGEFLWMTGHMQEYTTTLDGSGPVVVTSPSSSTNALFMGDYFTQTQVGFPFWNVAAGGHVYGKNNQTLPPASGSMPTADTGGTPAASEMTNFLAQMRSHLPAQNVSLPAGVDDIRLDRLWMNGATNSLTVVTP